MRQLIITAILLAPSAAFASGLAPAEGWKLTRDGAWIFNFAILFGFLFWVVKRFLLPALQNRSEEIASTLEEAEKAREESMAKLQDLEKRLKEFEEEAARMKKDAEDEGLKIKKEILENAQKQASRILEKAKTEIEGETQRARKRLRDEAVEMAVKIAGEILESGVKEDDHKKIVDQYLETVEGGK